jgi:hypothetical protein
MNYTSLARATLFNAAVTSEEVRYISKQEMTDCMN